MKPDDHQIEPLFTQEDINNSLKLLELFNQAPEQFGLLSKEQKISLMKAAGALSRPGRKAARERNQADKEARKAAIKQQEKQARAKTGIRSARGATIFTAPMQITNNKRETTTTTGKLNTPRKCYVCKKEFVDLHPFYDAMCTECGDLNYTKRFQRCDLTGQVALITGSRLKIGYQAALMLLESGATVIATTRFPIDSAKRYSKEPGFKKWGSRLHIYGLDLRHTPSVESFCTHIQESFARLDILINNAAQTVRRPPNFYQHLMALEQEPFENQDTPTQKLLANFRSCIHALGKPEDNAPPALFDAVQGDRQLKPDDLGSNTKPVTLGGVEGGKPKNQDDFGLKFSAQMSQMPYTYDNFLASSKDAFPEGKLDCDLQQVDLRKTNSWRLKLGEIQTSEMLEIQLVNAVAPFVLCNRLAQMMKRDNTGCKHIVNVTAMEGKFFRFNKGDRHPHTNMAKAALNMLTHTSASGLAKHGIYMNAVDTGWVTDEDPVHLSRYKQDVHDFQPPLDIVDGAARVCDPFIYGILTGKHWCGQFLKDYFPIDW